jgi:hypothetical protein
MLYDVGLYEVDMNSDEYADAGNKQIPIHNEPTYVAN